MHVNKKIEMLKVGPDTSVFLVKFSSIDVYILSFKFEGGFVQYKCTGDIPIVLLDEEMPATDHSTN